jgi:hypothetical protein
MLALIVQMPFDPTDQLTFSIPRERLLLWVTPFSCEIRVALVTIAPKPAPPASPSVVLLFMPLMPRTVALPYGPPPRYPYVL